MMSPPRLCSGTIHRAIFALGPDYLLGVDRTIENIANLLD